MVKEEKGQLSIVIVGPTTSPRMVPYSPAVITQGVRALVGKGNMDEDICEAMKHFGAVFLAAASGCANIHAQSIEEVLNVHWLDLGTTEAIWAVKVKDWGPLIVTIDAHGNNLYLRVVERARERLKTS